LRWPGNVDVSTQVERIGRSSVTLAQALRTADAPPSPDPSRF
jgi:acyl-CoA thioesterase FadM